MQIRFTSKRLEKISQDDDKLLEYCKLKKVDDPVDTRDRIQLALSHIDAAPTMHDIPEFFRPHALVVDLYGHYGLDVADLHRLVLRPDHDDKQDFNWENTRSISRVEISEICKDYHKSKKEAL